MKRIDCVVIPARGGSKRILRKNLAPFLGIPMLERSIKLAKKVSDCVIVSSDDSEILEVAKNLGAYALERDGELSNDFSATLPVIVHALFPFLPEDIKQLYQMRDEMKQLFKNASMTPKVFFDKTQIPGESLQVSLDKTVLCLYPTAMFATKDSLMQAQSMLEKNKGASYIVSVVAQTKVYRSFTCNDDGYFQFMFPQFMQTRTQDLPESFCDAGQFYLGYAKSFLEQIPMLGGKSLGIVLEGAWDIDTPSDLAIAQTLFAYRNKDE